MTVDLGIDGISNASLVGRGGSAVVYRAEQENLGRTVAVKVLKTSEDPAVKRRFDRESRTIGSLSDSGGIVTVYQTGTTATGELYLLMPFFERGSLQDRLVEGPMPWQEAGQTVLSVAHTIGRTHAAGVVHRDLKPANIMLGPEGEPHVADFGIAKLVDSLDSASMSTGLTYTPAYSPPEAFSVALASPQVDVYGLGATLWALIAGRPPFYGVEEVPPLPVLMNRVISEPIPPAAPDVPQEVSDVIAMAMAKNPEERFADAGLFSAALSEALEGRVHPAVVAPASSAYVRPNDGQKTIVAGTPTIVAATPAKRRFDRRRLAVVAAVVLGFVGLGVAGASVLGRDGGDEGVVAISPALPDDDPDSEQPEVEQELTSPAAPESSPSVDGDDSGDSIDQASTTTTTTTTTTTQVAPAPEAAPETPSPQPESEQQADSQRQTQPETQRETQPETQSESQPQSQPDTEAQNQPAPRPVTVSGSARAESHETGRVIFETSECTFSQFTSAGGPGGKSTPVADRCATRHEFVLGSDNYFYDGPLSPSTRYTVTFVGTTEDGRKTASETVTFTTNAAPAPPPITFTATVASIPCDGTKHSFGNLAGLTPEGRVSFSSVPSSPIHVDGIANGSGQINGLGWICTEPGTWSITALDQATGRTKTYSVTGVAP